VEHVVAAAYKYFFSHRLFLRCVKFSDNLDRANNVLIE